MSPLPQNVAAETEITRENAAAIETETIEKVGKETTREPSTMTGDKTTEGTTIAETTDTEMSARTRMTTGIGIGTTIDKNPRHPSTSPETAEEMKVEMIGDKTTEETTGLRLQEETIEEVTEKTTEEMTELTIEEKREVELGEKEAEAIEENLAEIM